MNISPNIEAGLANIQSSLDQMSKSIRGLLLFQQFATNEINNLKSREGTSQRGNKNGGNQYDRLTKLEFPKFNGEGVQALNWHKQFVKRFRENVSWEEYEREIKMMFDLVFEDPMVDLKNLRQTTSVQVYQDLFEALMNTIELTESYAITKMQEQTIVVTKNRHASLLSTPKTSIVNANKYMPRHKCSGQVFSLEVVGIDMEEDGDLLLTKDGIVNTYQNFIDEPPLISLNALSGDNTYRTIRFRGCVGRNSLHVLVDSESTHNFLDLQTAKKLGYRLRKIFPLDVSVANGNVMTNLNECKGFTWVFQGVTYTSNVMILPLEGCDMVFGV
ncbi:putative cytochrome P450 [Tanacetum coccineum]